MSDVCAICLEDNGQKRLACTHTFHEGCLRPMAKRTCPLCRAPFTLTPLVYYIHGQRTIYDLKPDDVVYSDSKYVYVMNAGSIVLKVLKLLPELTLPTNNPIPKLTCIPKVYPKKR